MLDGVSPAYIKDRWAKMPEVKQGEEHKVKKGETLWSISRKQLGSKATKSEISDYMFAIAKLSGLDTSEKMNNLNIGQKLLLPEALGNKSQTATAKPAPQPVTNPVEQDLTQPKSPMLFEPIRPERIDIKPTLNPVLIETDKTLPKTVTDLSEPAAKRKIPAETTDKKSNPQFTQAEQSFMSRVNTILTDKTVFVQRATLPTSTNGKTMYHVFSKSKDGNSGLLMSFNIDKQGNITNIIFEDDKNIDLYGYDYKINSNNEIVSFRSYNTTLYGKANREQIAMLHNKLRSLVKQAS